MARKHLAVVSQNSPQLKRVANATDEFNLGKTARASSGLATLPQETQASAQPSFAARRATSAAVEPLGSASVPRAYQPARAADAPAPQFGYLYGMALLE